MSLSTIPGQVEKFVGMFYRTNAVVPPPRPDFPHGIELQELVIAKGMLKITWAGGGLDVVIDEKDQLPNDVYQNFIPVIVNELTKLLMVPHLASQISTAMHNAGIAAHHNDYNMVISPLTSGNSMSDCY